MDRNRLFAVLQDNFHLEPTTGQLEVMRHLSAFLLSEKANPVYILKGYAGTGKTSLVGTLVKVLPMLQMRFVLMAPTGRAAKVLQSYSGKPASTIHRKIYMRRSAADGAVRLVVAPNMHRNTLFIVDEASMIGDNNSEGGRYVAGSLLNDLMEYVQDGEDCRLLLIGDHAQLPPVGIDSSPALDLVYLKASFSVTIASYELTEVMRQALESGLLSNATALRSFLQQERFELPLFSLNNHTDISMAGAYDFEELLHEAFGGREFGKAVIICRSNRRANNFNNAVRARILGYDDVLSGGELLMVVKNNYHWISEPGAMGFIANGDMMVVNRLIRTEEMYGFLFADADVSFPDYPEQQSIQVKLLLNTLTIDGPALPEQDLRKLTTAIEEDYADIPNRSQRREKLRSDPYFNALQVKYAYALTCHKTQGGQWPLVFVDGGGLPAENLDASALRWLYTALTRAIQRLVLVNFSEKYFF